MSNPEVCGGIPVTSVIGTPRAMGESMGNRLKPRLQVLAQYLLEQLGSQAQAGGRKIDARQLRENLRTSVLPNARTEPGLWMEIESMARATGLPEEDLLLVHGYGDLLSLHGCRVPPSRSSYIGLTSAQTASHGPCLVMAWHLDPALLPYVTLVRRMPSNGPGSLSLTLAGLHPVACLSESGLAVACNEFRVTDGTSGKFVSHLVGSAMTSPALEDAYGRVTSGARQGGAAIHVVEAAGGRFSVELSGSQMARLPDPLPEVAPRVHTNHPLDLGILRWLADSGDATSKNRLERLASMSVPAREVTPDDIASWFGLGEREPPTDLRLRQARDYGAPTDHTVLFIADPAGKRVHLRRGGTSSRLESIAL